MVVEGVVIIEDIDKVMWVGFGLCWVVMGLIMLFYFGVGDGGLKVFCDYFQDMFNGWWDGFGDLWLDEKVIEVLVLGMVEQVRGWSLVEFFEVRDKMLVVLQVVIKDLC